MSPSAESKNYLTNKITFFVVDKKQYRTIYFLIMKK